MASLKCEDYGFECQYEIDEAKTNNIAIEGWSQNKINQSYSANHQNIIAVWLIRY